VEKLKPEAGIVSITLDRLELVVAEDGQDSDLLEAGRTEIKLLEGLRVVEGNMR